MTHSADNPTPMRFGLTTGTCAAAAAKAAALAISGAVVSAVEIVLPGGDEVVVPIASVEVLGAHEARAAVVKDAGDDPDITNGMTVVASVDVGGERVRYEAGPGVGTVTRPGLQLEPGEPAINPVPREMIEAALVEVLGRDAGALVTISIPGGEEVAEKTFGPKLGIAGGLSIIGTSGRVEPKSTEAWMRSLLPQVDVALAAGHTTVWLVPGGIGEEYAIEALGAPREAVVQCSNFVGALLDKCGEGVVERVMLVGHAGKLVKVAAGLFDTHSRAGDARLETVAAVAAAEGASGPLAARLLELATVQAAIAELERAGLTGVWGAIAKRAASRASDRCGLPVDVVLLGYGGEALGSTAAFERPPASGGTLAVVGVGPGSEELMLPASWKEIRAAEVVAGGTRLLDAFAPAAAEKIAIRGDVDAALAAVDEAFSAGKRVVVLASGDPSFFGILATVRRVLPELEPRVVPGVSSAQLAMARLSEGWEGLSVASAHGRDASEALRTCESAERTLVLVDRSTPAEKFAAELAHRGEFEVTVLERLGYPEERITTAAAPRIAEGTFDPLSVLFVRKL